MANIVLAALSTGIEGGFSVIYDIPQDLWDRVSQIFDKSNVNKLLWNISGDNTATVDNMAPIEALAATRMTSEDMIANYNKVNSASADEDLSAATKSAAGGAAYYASANAASVSANHATSREYLIPANSASANDDYAVSAKSYEAEIIVELGGLKWTPVYLSTTNEGKDSEPHDVILTLWLADNQQDAWADRKADEGEYYGFLDGALYSDWSADWMDDSSTVDYPSHMYGMSYMSAVVLNNGGNYATSITTLSAATQSESNAFALFTMAQFGLTKYLVTPEHVSWQEDGQKASEVGGDYVTYNLPNENWSQNTTVGNFYENNHFEGKAGNDAWKDDYLWLTSYSETGYKDNYNGIWKTSTAQRKLNSSAYRGTVGNGNYGFTAQPFTMHRSGWITGGSRVSGLAPDGNRWASNVVSVTYTVRPALHLNLTEVAKSLKK